MTLLDFAIVVAVLSTAVWGAVRGLALQVGAILGLWLGLFIGAALAPHVAGLADSATTKLLLTTFTVAALASLAAAGGHYLGALLGQALNKAHLGPLDATLGALVTMVATMALLWIGLTSIAGSQSGFSRAIQDSKILTTLDDLLPPVPSVTARIGRLIDPLGFPRVFAGLEPGPAPAVDTPGSTAVAAAEASGTASTVKFESRGCGGIIDGSGVVVGAELVITNAHVIAGIRVPSVNDNGTKRAATPVLFDPDLDLAVLRVPGLDRPAIALAPDDPKRGDTGAALGFPGGGDFTVLPAAVRAVFAAVGRDIYGNGLVTRQVEELQADVRPGSSGGPFVLADGTLGGVVFARSVSTTGVGYALAISEVRPKLTAAVTRTERVSTGACAAG